MQRINQYKGLLKEIAKKFYLHQKISDETVIGQKTWKEMKDEVWNNNQYKEKEWYQKLKYYEKELIEEMKQT